MARGSGIVGRAAAVAAAVAVFGGSGACAGVRGLDEAALLAEIRAARSPSATPSELDEEEAVRRVASSPAVQAAQGGVDEARGELIDARSWNNPELRLDNDYRRRGSDSLDREVYRLQVDLRLDIPPLFETLARVDAAEAGVSAAKADAAAAQGRAVRDVRLAFARAATARARAAAWDRLAETRRLRAASLDRGVQGGLDDPTDAAAAKAGSGDAAGRAGRDRVEEESAKADLRRVLGTGGAVVLRVPEGGPACAVPPPDVAGLEERVLGSSPGLAVHRERHRQAREEARAEAMAWIPWPKFVEVGYTYNTLTGYNWLDPNEVGAPIYKHWGVHGGIAIDLPIWNWNRGKTLAAEGKADQEAAWFRDELADAVGDVGREVERWRGAYERIRRLRDESLPAAEAALAAARRAVEAGRAPEADALRVEERVLELRLRLLEDALECRAAELEVRRVTGEL